jgi:hypothetical protein
MLLTPQTHYALLVPLFHGRRTDPVLLVHASILVADILMIRKLLSLLRHGLNDPQLSLAHHVPTKCPQPLLLLLACLRLRCLHPWQHLELNLHVCGV